MCISSRFKAIATCAAIFATIGCEATNTTVSGAPQKEGDGYAKKLVGIWEGIDEDAKDKFGKPLNIVFEFSGDGKMKASMGPFDLAGTWKIAKEDGKTLTVDTEMLFNDIGFGGERKPDKQTISIRFENDNTIVVTPIDKKESKTLKRKK